MPTIPQLAECVFESICKPPALKRKSQEFYKGSELKRSDTKKCAQCSDVCVSQVWLLEKGFPALEHLAFFRLNQMWRRLQQVRGKSGLSLPLPALQLPCKAVLWPHTHGDKGENAIFILVSFLWAQRDGSWPHSSQPGPREVAKAGEKGEQPHFSQPEPSARLAAVKSRAAPAQGIELHCQMEQKSHVAEFVH